AADAAEPVDRNLRGHGRLPLVRPQNLIATGRWGKVRQVGAPVVTLGLPRCASLRATAPNPVGGRMLPLPHAPPTLPAPFRPPPPPRCGPRWAPRAPLPPPLPPQPPWGSACCRPPTPPPARLAANVAGRAPSRRLPPTSRPQLRPGRCR